MPPWNSSRRDHRRSRCAPRDVLRLAILLQGQSRSPDASGNAGIDLAGADGKLAPAGAEDRRMGMSPAQTVNRAAKPRTNGILILAEGLHNYR
jgi:hypothetical protein